MMKTFIPTPMLEASIRQASLSEETKRSLLAKVPDMDDEARLTLMDILLDVEALEGEKERAKKLVAELEGAQQDHISQ